MRIEDEEYNKGSRGRDIASDLADLNKSIEFLHAVTDKLISRIDRVLISSPLPDTCASDAVPCPPMSAHAVDIQVCREALAGLTRRVEQTIDSVDL